MAVPSACDVTLSLELTITRLCRDGIKTMLFHGDRATRLVCLRLRGALGAGAGLSGTAGAPGAFSASSANAVSAEPRA